MACGRSWAHELGERAGLGWCWARSAAESDGGYAAFVGQLLRGLGGPTADRDPLRRLVGNARRMHPIRPPAGADHADV